MSIAIRQQLLAMINQSLERLGLPEPEQLTLEQPANRDHGDYAVNAAMVLFGQLQQDPAASQQAEQYSNPRQLAEAIAADINDHLKPNQQEIQKIKAVTVAGPGFINFKLTEPFFTSKIAQMAKDPIAALDQPEKKQKIIVEYSSPNIAKPFTIGHLRSTIIGDAVANLLETAGHQIFRDNHIGDWGTQFGKQIYAIKTWGDEAKIAAAANPLKELVKLYVKFHQQAEEDPELEDKARAWFRKLEAGDPEARRLWQQCIDWSWQRFEEIYQQLGVEFSENDGRGYGESYFEDKMDSVITELKEKDLLTESEGAQLVFFPNEEYPPLMILKSDGSTLYATRDLATDKFRKQHYGDDITIINETGSEQNLYFQQVFKIEEMLGWFKPEQRVHIGHGMIRFKEGKMSTRKGNVIWLEDVLQQAFARVEELASNKLSEATKWKIAIGALKWNDLKRSPHLPITFDWDEVINLQGNAGPYLQYTHVRCQSIFATAAEKWGRDPAELKSDVTKQIDTLLNLLMQGQLNLQPIEKELLRNLYSYYETFNHSVKEQSPHYLANYLYELAQMFNSFYNKHPVIGDMTDEASEKTAAATGSNGLPEVSATTHFRLLLTLATARTLAAGLQILGIETVEKM